MPDFSLRPQGFHCIKVTAKVLAGTMGETTVFNIRPLQVTSINLGIIIGTVMYSTSMSTDVSIVNLDKIFINMAEFIRPASCTLVEVCVPLSTYNAAL